MIYTIPELETELLLVARRAREGGISAPNTVLTFNRIADRVAMPLPHDTAPMYVEPPPDPGGSTDPGAPIDEVLRARHAGRR